MYWAQCVYCEIWYLTDSPLPCRSCFQFHCRKCACSRFTFGDDYLVFKPFFYAPKTFRIMTTKVEDSEPEPESPTLDAVKKWNPALWGAGFSALLLGTLWYRATMQANSAPQTSIVPRFIDKYETGIKACDYVLHRIFPRPVSQPLVSMSGIPEMLFKTLQNTAIDGIPRTFDLAKMVANPTPMPFTTVWQSPSEFMRTLRLTGFLGFAKESTIKAALLDGLLLSTGDAERTARQLLAIRKMIAQRGAGALVGGLSVGFVPGLLVPGYSVVAGSLIPYNLAAIFNSFSQSVSILEQRTKQVAPESHAILHKHIDAFWKGKATKVKGAGLAGIIPLVLGYGYMQYEGFKKLFGSK